MAAQKTSSLEELRSQWTELYSKTLPALARARDPAQAKWPVTLDHCFARIILDNTVGRGALQWDNVIKRPAVRNMDESQLAEAIALGEKIREGDVNLVELDQQSLRVRGKGEKKYESLRSETKKEHTELSTSASTSTSTRNKKRPRDEQEEEDTKDVKKEEAEQGNEKSAENQNSRLSKQKKTSTTTTAVSSGSKQSTLPFSEPTTSTNKPNSNPDLPNLLSKISTHPTLTPFRKRLYSTLLSVPPGHFTTYAAMATYLSSSARAVGNGMRNNPFAPEVPCHRVLASDRSIGGFGGDWGDEGKHAAKKRELLAGEGVKFDTKGRVKGRGWEGLKDLSVEA